MRHHLKILILFSILLSFKIEAYEPNYLYSASYNEMDPFKCTIASEDRISLSYYLNHRFYQKFISGFPKVSLPIVLELCKAYAERYVVDGMSDSVTLHMPLFGGMFLDSDTESTFAVLEKLHNPVYFVVDERNSAKKKAFRFATKRLMDRISEGMDAELLPLKERTTTPFFQFKFNYLDKKHLLVIYGSDGVTLKRLATNTYSSHALREQGLKECFKWSKRISVSFFGPGYNRSGFDRDSGPGEYDDVASYFFWKHKPLLPISEYIGKTPTEISHLESELVAHLLPFEPSEQPLRNEAATEMEVIELAGQWIAEKSSEKKKTTGEEIREVFKKIGF